MDHDWSTRTNRSVIKSWWLKWPHANIGIRTGIESGIVVIDVDPRHDGDLSFKELETEYEGTGDGPRGQTGSGGFHIYKKHSGGRIPCIQGLRPGVDIKADGGYVIAPPSMHELRKRYKWTLPFDHALLPAVPPDLLTEIREPKQKQRSNGSADTGNTDGNNDPIYEKGQRNAALHSLAGSMRRRGMPIAAILVALLELNKTQCKPPLDEDEVERLTESSAKYEPDPEFHNAQTGSTKPREEKERPWPKVNEAALHGVAGDIVRLISPHTEADPVAILIQVLVLFGSSIGRKAHFLVEETKHFANLFVALVGTTAKARKGTSLGRVVAVFDTVKTKTSSSSTNPDEIPPKDLLPQIRSGLVSGEGLVHHCRDEVTKLKPAKDGRGDTRSSQ